MENLRETTYARELARAVVPCPGGEMRMERLHINELNREEIRFSWWPNQKMAQKPLDVTEAELLTLFEQAVDRGVLSPDFRQSLKELLERTTT